jgi:hypothetical protein
VGDRADHVSARIGLHAALLAWPSERLSARRRPRGPDATAHRARGLPDRDRDRRRNRPPSRTPSRSLRRSRTSPPSPSRTRSPVTRTPTSDRALTRANDRAIHAPVRLSLRAPRCAPLSTSGLP